jgi:hypothetical protein
MAAKNADHSASSGASKGSSAHALVGRVRRRGRARTARTAAAARSAARYAWRKRSTGSGVSSASRSPCRAWVSRSRTLGGQGGGPAGRGRMVGVGTAAAGTSASWHGSRSWSHRLRRGEAGGTRRQRASPAPPPSHIRTCVRYSQRNSTNPVPVKEESRSGRQTCTERGVMKACTLVPLLAPPVTAAYIGGQQ